MEIAALFDLDGVIIDSETSYTLFWEDIQKIHPVDADNFAMRIKGSTLPTILDTYFPDSETQNDILIRLENFERQMAYPIFPEAARFISELNRAGIKCAVVTSSQQDKMQRLYMQQPEFSAHFNAIITGDMVRHSKPHPEPYLSGAAALGVNIRNCFVFEDSVSGIMSGMNAGATVIGLATTLPYSTIAGKAHKTIHDFTGFHIRQMLEAREVPNKP